MANRLQNIAWTIANVALRQSTSIATLFQPLLFSSVFDPTLPRLAEIALIVAFLPVSARIICTFPGSYFFNLPGEMQI